MATSRFEARRIRIPPDATADEAAAIVAAIDRLLAARAPSEPDATGIGADPWRFATRLEAVTGGPVRRHPGVPRDPWRAAMRLYDR